MTMGQKIIMKNNCAAQLSVGNIYKEGNERYGR